MRALILLLAFAATANAADLSIAFTDASQARTARVGGLYFTNVTVGNRTASEPSGATVEIAFDPAITVDDIHQTTTLQCQSGPGKITCTTPEVKHGSNYLGMTLRMPAAPEGGDFELTATVTAPGADPDPSNNTAKRAFHVIRQMIVDNINDDGPGSLRTAIVNANGWCTTSRPCEIQFRFPEGAVPVIEPLTPLPDLTACHVLFGTPAHPGENPTVELSGRRVSSGPGLVVRTGFCLGNYYGLAINGFPEDGLVIASGLASVHEFAIGTDASGTRVIPNGGRGIAVRGGRLHLIDSLVGGNHRSGITLFSGYADLYNVHVGIGRDGRDLGNGASGVFVAPGPSELRIQWATIANHPHFGVALAGSGPVNISAATVIKDNILDLDWFLDGPTANSDGDSIPNAPRILSARYDAATNTTRVTLILTEPDAAKHHNLELRLWASDRVTIFGTAHLEQLAARKWIDAGTATSEPITIEVSGDLRGKQLSAVMTVWTIQPFLDSPAPAMIDTSETGAAVRVE